MARLLPWVLALLFAGLWLARLAQDGWQDATAAHLVARQTFLAEFAFEGCVSRDTVLAEAAERGWQVDTRNNLPWCDRPEGPADWLRITVSPPLPISKADENAEYIGFDAMGCALPDRPAC